MRYVDGGRGVRREIAPVGEVSKRFWVEEGVEGGMRVAVEGGNPLLNVVFWRRR